MARSAAAIAGHETEPCPLEAPPVGRLRCGEWLLFAGVHDLMHLEQLHRIARTRSAGRQPALMAERPAPLVLVPSRRTGERPFGTLRRGGWRPGGACSPRSSRAGSARPGAAVAAAAPGAGPSGEPLPLGTLVRGAAPSGRWSARRARGGPVDAIGYAGAGSLALLDDAAAR